MKICISCMGTTNLLNLFDTHLCDGEEEVYSDFLHKCFDIQIPPEENLNYICASCVFILRDALAFKLQIKSTLSILKLARTEPQENAKMATYEFDGNIAESYLDPESGVLCGNESESKCDGAEGNFSMDCSKENESSQNTPDSDEGVTKRFNIKPGQTTCNICDKQFLNNKTLLQHLHVHNSRHVCELCGKGFSDKRSFRRHKLTHKNGEYTCKYCNLVFTKNNTLHCHIWRLHRSDTPYLCKCGQRFKTKDQRLKHMKLEHGATEKLYQCEHCDKSFYDAGARSKHNKLKHEVPMKQKCHLCPMELVNKNVLKRHLASKHSIGERKHVCKVCDRKFYDSSGLAMHNVVHEKSNLFHCPHCDLRFNYKYIMKNHILKKHDGVEENGGKIDRLTV